jgi:hypothetical protein
MQSSRKMRRRAAPLTFGKGNSHKIKVASTDALTAASLRSSAQRAKRFHSYTLFDVSRDALARLNADDLERIELRDDWNVIALRAGQIDTTGGEPLIPESLRQAEGLPRSLHLVQLFGPPTPDAVESLKKTGVELVSYVPNNAYLVWATPQSIRRIRALRDRFTQWDGPFHPAFKLDPAVALDSDSLVRVSIEMLDADSEQSIAQIRSASLKTLMPEFAAAGTIHIKAVVHSSKLAHIARLAPVISIETWPEIRLDDERANQIVAGELIKETINNVDVSRPTRPGYAAFLDSLGINSNLDFAVEVGDSGFDLGTSDVGRMHRDFLDQRGLSRIAYLNDYTADENLHETAVFPAHDPNGHGTLNASIIGGLGRSSSSQFVDSLGFQYGQGVNPFVQIGVSKIFDDNGGFTTRASFADITSVAYRNGARVANNSWGLCNLEFGFCNLYGDDARVYDSLVRDADPFSPGNQSISIIFTSGNRGHIDPLSIGIPGTAKNVITVGASEGFRMTDDSGQPIEDGCGVGPTLADNASDIAIFSSGGPVQDGRAKPDLVAPGTHITGAAPQDSFYAAKPEDDIGVCDRYFPAGQTLYSMSTGTSHSAPLVAGGAALAFHWLRERLGAEPSPALVKAMLLNSTSYLSGRFGGDNLPGARQGWGLMNLSRMFEPADRALYDESPSRTFTSSGEEAFEITGVISDPSKEFRVMLTWSDAPGNPAFNVALVNQLNLEVTVGGVLYNGNNFSGQYSSPGGARDALNNVQGVRLPAGLTGPFRIRVSPTVIAGDGVPGNGIDLDQDFALVVFNGREAAVPVLSITESEGISEGVTVRHRDGSSDSWLIPGETALVTISVRNLSSTASLAATSASLSLAGGATAFSSFPLIGAGGVATNAEPFQIVVPSEIRCGAAAEFQLRLATELGTVSLPLRIRSGRASGSQTILSDDVDGMSVKWKMRKGFTVATGIGTSGSMSYHAVDPGKEEDDAQLSEMFSKKKFSIPSNAGRVRLSFFHIFNFEPGFDGGVMEISTDGGLTWQDLGSRIIVGTYDGKVTSASENPLGNRLAWTARGRAGVFSQVVINLDDFAGQRVRLRFLGGFDGATGVRNGYTGWFIDDIRITAQNFTCR